MKYSIQYIPLTKIKPHLSVQMTQHLKSLRNVMWDCTHLIAVQQNKKKGSFSIISGHDRYEHLCKHTTKKVIPCLVHEGSESSLLKRLIKRLHYPHITADQMTPTSWKIVKSFLKKEPRFKQLSHIDQLKVLSLAFQYKKTVVSSMRMGVDQQLKKK